MNDVPHTLASLRRRMMTQFFIDRVVLCALGFAVLLLASAAINAARGATPVDARAAGAVLSGVFVSAFVWTRFKTPTLKETAVRVDGLMQTRDRFLTAYDFSNIENRTALQEIALEECRRYIAACDAAACARFRFPPLLPWLLVPLVVLCLMGWHAHFAKIAAGRETRRATAEQARELEKLAREIDAANEKEKSDDLKKIADEIRKGEKRLQAARPDDAQKAALREMSSLENMVWEMLKSQKKSTPEELAALAAALKQSELTKSAADALQTGNPEAAAEKLERLLQQQKQEAELDKVAQAVQQALSRLAQDQKGEMGRRMEQTLQSGGQNGAQALQRLAELLREAGNAQQGKSGDGSPSQQTMRNMLAALQNMKYGAQQERMGAGQQQGNSDSKMTVQPFGKPNAQNAQQLSLTDLPSGMPGSEHDIGTTENPFGAPQKKNANEAAGIQLNGVLGEGESLHDFMTATGDKSKSNRRYRELYNAMLPAAEDAVQQEAIPPGSRFYIKRYFQAIRPE